MSLPASTSWWWDDALRTETDARPCLPLLGQKTVDVAVVGGGFTGLWTALALKERRPSLSVALIEASECGSGASGKNGGKVHGYWASLGGMARLLGDDAALEVAQAGTRAQDAIRAFSTRPGTDVWWRESGNIRVSAAPGQDAKLAGYVSEAQRLGVPDTVMALSPAQVQSHCQSPAFRAGLYLPEGANVHPARLARALRAEALAQGVTIYENTPMTGLDRDTPNLLHTPLGSLVARDVILATNAALGSDPYIAPHLCILSSFALMTDPAGEALESIWPGSEGIADLRMFLHYFRKTRDGRVLMGSGSGPIGYGGRTDDHALRFDAASAARAESGLRRLLPALAGIGLAQVWGGAIDVSSDRLPFFGTFPGTRVHFGCGYSGHGVNATYIGGRCLSAIALDIRDEWSTLPLCTRTLPTLPPEPFRTVGGRAIRWGIIRCEEADERKQTAPLAAQALAALPTLFGMKIGTR